MRSWKVLFALAALAGCAAPTEDTSTPVPTDSDTLVAHVNIALAADDPGRGFTADFRAFLAANPTYASFDFARDDLGTNAYGGRVAAGDPVTRQPVVFVHGNSDRGLGGTYGGWDDSITYFRGQGYAPQELYAFTWGDADPAFTATQYHSKANLTRVRTFLQAVLAYTGASKIDVVGHSMGVTLARKAILGGSASDALAGGSYNLGSSLGSKVDAFLGIAGANVGLTSCWYSGPSTPTCGATNGFYPGTLSGFGVVGRSSFLNDLLGRTGEASYVAAMYSPSDEILGPGALVWGTNTALIPGETSSLTLATGCGHFQSKTGTGPEQLAIVSGHHTTGAGTSCTN